MIKNSDSFNVILEDINPKKTDMELNNLDRRDFIKGSAATLALTSLSAKGFANALDAKKQYKVGLIGSGWYGKSDLFRLIQVANVDVVTLCDVDTKMLAEAI